MEVLNDQERVLESDLDQLVALLDSLSNREDRLWTKHIWPCMEFDRPLGIGASGGHEPIRYFVEEYTEKKAHRQPTHIESLPAHE